MLDILILCQLQGKFIKNFKLKICFYGVVGKIFLPWLRKYHRENDKTHSMLPSKKLIKEHTIALQFYEPYDFFIRRID